MYRCLYANAAGDLIDCPSLGMLGRSGQVWLEPDAAEMMPLPKGATLVSIPGRPPVGMNSLGFPEILEYDPWETNQPVAAVAALLPQGFTRTLYPAYANSPNAPALPLLGYAAVAWFKDQIHVAAIPTDEHRKWHPQFYNTSGLAKRIQKMQRQMPNNQIVQQLAHCSLQYGCFTAQNIFYGRWEGGIPVSPSCNAACIGCISDDHPEVAAPQRRLLSVPAVEDIVELGCRHLEAHREAIISFGQGCEGEPSLQAPLIAAAIRQIRQRTSQGTINMNTNAGYTEGIRLLCQAGIDSLRISLFSARDKYYHYYHQPNNYSLTEVKRSMDYANDCGVKLALNLLLFPGFHDSEAETEALIRLMREHHIAMIQLRNLNIDPDLLFAGIDEPTPAAGIPSFLYRLQEELPQLQIASYSHPVKTGA